LPSAPTGAICDLGAAAVSIERTRPADRRAAAELAAGIGMQQIAEFSPTAG
jgi:hypothetical protein